MNPSTRPPSVYGTVTDIVCLGPRALSYRDGWDQGFSWAGLKVVLGFHSRTVLPR